MTITLVNVSTLNGKITKGNDPHVPEWSSVEDQKHFASVVKEFEVIILGRKTYEAIGKPLPNRTNIIITIQPMMFKSRIFTILPYVIDVKVFVSL